MVYKLFPVEWRRCGRNVREGLSGLGHSPLRSQIHLQEKELDQPPMEGGRKVLKHAEVAAAPASPMNDGNEMPQDIIGGAGLECGSNAQRRVHDRDPLSDEEVCRRETRETPPLTFPSNKDPAINH